MFESGQNKGKVCSCILKDRECNPLFVAMDTSCKHYFKRDNVFVATYKQQLSPQPTTAPTLKSLV